MPNITIDSHTVLTRIKWGVVVLALVLFVVWQAYQWSQNVAVARALCEKGYTQSGIAKSYVVDTVSYSPFTHSTIVIGQVTYDYSTTPELETCMVEIDFRGERQALFVVPASRRSYK